MYMDKRLVGAVLTILLMMVALSPGLVAAPSDVSIYQSDGTAVVDAGSTSSIRWLVYNNGTDRLLLIPQMTTSLPDRMSYTLEPSYAILDPGQGCDVYLNVSARNDMYTTEILASVSFNVTDMVVISSEEYEKQVTLDVQSIYGNLDRQNKILGVWDNFLPAPLNGNWGAFIVSLLIWIGISVLVMEVLGPTLRRLTLKTATKWDDIIVGLVRMPIFLFLLSYGTVSSLEILELEASTVADLELTYSLVLVMIGALLAYRILVRVMISFAKERSKRTAMESDDILVSAVELLGKIIVPVATAFVIAGILGIDLGGMILGVGFLGLVIGYATQSTLSNLFAGMQLVLDRPFRVGDRVPLADGHTSEVTDIGLITTKFLDLDTAEEVIMPNALIESRVIVNMSYPDTRFKVNVKVKVSDREDPKRIEDLMMEASRRTPQILQGGNAPVVRVSEIKGGRMLLTIFIWVDHVNNRHIARTEYRTNLYKLFNESGVEFAFPRNMVTLNRD